MAAPSPNAILDNVEVLQAGMHGGISPSMLTPYHAAYLVNATTRGGKARTRPALVKRTLVHSGSTATTSTAARFQGAAAYASRGNQPDCILAKIGGRLFRYLVTTSTLQVQDITPSDGPDNSTLPHSWLFQGEDFMVINDGISLPIFFDGAGARRSLGPAGNELPTSCMGTYCNGRFAVVLPVQGSAGIPSSSYIAGDLVYNTSSGTPAYNYRDSILKTNDNANILNGAAFAIPINSGRITSMFSVAIPDTSLGQGPLQVGTRKGVFAVDLPLDATLWTSLQQPTQVVSLPAPGPTSHYAVSVVNTDAWYRAKDGIRSYQIGRRDMNTWVQTALSAEMDPVLKYDTSNLLEFASAVTFDNRLITTASPYFVASRGIAHRGLIALDFHNISALTTRSQPSYDGLWTGVPVLQAVTGTFNGIDRCFLFALDATQRICIYELIADSASPNFDFDGADNIPTESWLISRALWGLEQFTAEREKTLLKKLRCADVFLEELAGEGTFTAQYRSDAYPFWNDWKTFNWCATACAPPACPQPCATQYQYMTYVRLPDPADDCNPLTKRLYRTGYSFQVKLSWTGHALLDKFLTWSEFLPETIPGCPPTQVCQILNGPTDDPFTYVIESCNLLITTQPTNLTIFDEGATITLTFAYTGTASPFTIQWYRNGVALTDGGDISGATTTTLAIANADADDAASYYAIVTDSSSPTPCTDRTNIVTTVLNDPEDPGIIFNGEEPPTPPTCPGTGYLTFFDAYYTNSWGGIPLTDPSIDPNSVLNSTETACALALHLTQLNDYITGTLNPAGVIVNFTVQYWHWTASGDATQLQLYNKVATEGGNCDPNDGIGDWWAFMTEGRWSVASFICYTE